MIDQPTFAKLRSRRMACLVSVCLAAPVSAQDLDAAEVFARACEIYARTVFAERIRLEFEGSQPAAPPDIELRMAPQFAGQRLALRLGDLELFGQSNGDRGELRVVHRLDPTTCVVQAFDGALSLHAIRTVLPPIPLPQLSMALSGPAGGLGALANSIVWVSAEHLPDEPPRTLLIGRSNGRTVRVEIDDASHRLHAFYMELSGESGVSVLRAEVESVDPGALDAWTIDVSRRQPLAAASMLRPRPIPLEAGAVVDIKPLFLQDRSVWDLASAVADRRSNGRPGQRFAALVFVAWPAPERRSALMRQVATAISDVRKAEQALTARGIQESGLGPRRVSVGIECHPVVVFESVGEFSDSRLAEATTAISAAMPDPPDLLWTMPARQTIERLDLRAPIVLTLIDEQARLLRAIPIESGAAGSLDIKSAVEQAVLAEINLPVDPGPDDSP